MGNELVAFEESVKNRIKEIVAELIPEEKCDGIVRSTIAQFETVELPKLVNTELIKIYSKVIHDEFNKPEWIIQYNNDGKTIASEMVTKIATESAHIVIANMIGNTIQQTLYNLQGNLPRY